MQSIKRIVQYCFCALGSAIFCEGWNYLLCMSENQPFGINLEVVIPGGVSLGWALFQLLFIRNERRKRKEIGFFETVIISIQSGLIGLGSLGLILLFEKIVK